jgi:hypothetical protein
MSGQEDEIISICTNTNEGGDPDKVEFPGGQITFDSRSMVKESGKIIFCILDEEQGDDERDASSSLQAQQ